MAGVRKRKRVGGRDSGRSISELAVGDGQPARQFVNDRAVVAMQKDIEAIVRHTLYEKVAAYLWRAGVRSHTLAGGKTVARALTCGKHAVDTLYVCNAIGIIRRWEDAEARGEQVPPKGL